jgi:CubicO group peptidase (beta-lactamase class C family)
MDELTASIDALAAETGFSGVVRVDRDGGLVMAAAYGEADRACGAPCTVDTQFGIASGTKGLTALVIVSLIEDGTLALDTTARSLLGDDLPLVSDDVTIEHLLGHRSGIGDYLDEDVVTDFTDYVMPVPVHLLAATEDYLRVLDGHTTKFAPDERFSYCNGGFVILALLAERASGTPFDVLVHERVCVPAGMDDTEFLRSDELPGRAARGYLFPDGLRTNVLHLPVRGSGDGGIYTTAADVHALWAAVLGGNVVGANWVTAMVRPRSDVPEESARYGLGFWLHASSDAVMLVGGDGGVSFRTVLDPASGTVHTVLSNTTKGAWPITKRLDELLLE